MFDLAANPDLKSLADQIDELATRLILDGAAALVPADFENLSRIASSMGQTQLEIGARHLAQDLAAALPSPIPDRARLLDAGVRDLRNLLDPAAAGQAPVRSGACAAPVDETPSPSQENHSLAADEDLIREFITESSEYLATIENQLLVFEKNPADPETLNTIFRAFHTIKGLAGFFEFAEIQALTHEVETLLDLARNSQLTMGPAIIDIILESTDLVRQELGAITDKLAGNTPPPSAIDAAMLEKVRRAARTTPTPVVAPDGAAAPCTPVQAAGKAEPQKPSAQLPHPERRVSDATSVRIDTSKLDQLMDLVGEMVIAHTLVGHSPALEAVKDATLQRNLTQLARITADVQRITTAMRMVPIGLQFHKSARLVRDLARRAGKQIAFDTTGDETELDKTIAEQLADPLLHMVRNSIDHGIESPEERVARGKDPIAHIRVAAFHQSGQIVITVSDDGRGLDREKILAKAQRNGLIQPGSQVTESEIFHLIFEPGFSTAEKVTDISGRGVGMDVVRKNVQKLRGRIEIQSMLGQGTTFSIKLPLTLAIIEGLAVAVGDQRYIIPLFSVREMFRPTQKMLSTVHGSGEMVLVRDRLMPIVRLHRHFAVQPRTDRFTEGTLIVAESEGRLLCLFVDDLINKQEVVIKSLGHGFKSVTGVAGCAILGDGRVGLILDIDGIYTGRSA